MKFASEKSLLAGILIWTVTLLLLALTFIFLLHHDDKMWVALITGLPAIFLIWIWFNTGYRIENEFLKFKSGPIRGSIEIKDINTISTKKEFFAGLKPALSSNGCIIKYERWNEIYISPKNLNLFCAELLKINPAIDIV